MVLIVSLIIFLLDLAFDFMYQFEVDQVRKVQNSISANETVDETNTTDDSSTEDTNTTDTNTTSEEANDTAENETSSEENTDTSENSVSE